jgi:hypothetical protein
MVGNARFYVLRPGAAHGQLPRQFGAGEHLVFASDSAERTGYRLLPGSTSYPARWAGCIPTQRKALNDTEPAAYIRRAALSAVAIEDLLDFLPGHLDIDPGPLFL